MISLETFGRALYCACTDFMINTANIFGVTYKDANSFMFFILWPATTIFLILAATYQQHKILKLQRPLD